MNMDTKGFHGAMDNVHTRFEHLKTSIRGVGAAFKWLSIGVAAFGLSMGVLARSVYKTGIEFGGYHLKLTQLFHSAEQGEKTFKWLQALEKRTPFDLGPLVDAFSRLKMVGANPMGSLLEDLTDLAAFTKRPLEDIVSAVSKIQAGLPQMAMRQLISLGISRDALKSVGVQFSETGAMASGSMELILALQKLIQEQFHGMALASSQTFGGMVEKVEDAVREMKAIFAEKLFRVFKPMLKNFLDYLNELVDSGKVEVWANAFAKKIKEVYEKVKQWLPKIWETIKTIWAAIDATFGNLVRFLVDNPKLAAGGALAIGLGYALRIMKDIYLVGKSVVALGVLSSTAYSAKVATGTAVGTASATTGAIMGGAALTVAKIVPIVLAVAAAAGVAVTLMRTFKAAESPERERQKTNTFRRVLASRPGYEYDDDSYYAAKAEPRKPYHSPLVDNGRERSVVQQTVAELTDAQKLSAEAYEDYAEKIQGVQAKIDDETFKQGISRYDIYEQQKLALTREYSAKIAEVESDSRLLGKDKNELIGIYEKQKQAQLAMIEDSRIDESRTKASERALEIQNELSNRLTDLDNERFAISIMYLDEYEQTRLQIERDSTAQSLSIWQEYELSKLSFADAARLIELQNQEAAMKFGLNQTKKAQAEEEKQVEKTAKVKAKYLEYVDRLESNYVGRKLRLDKAIAATSIQMLGDTLSQELRMKGAVWAAEALAHLGAGIAGDPRQFAAAAKYAAAAAAAGIGAVMISEGARSLSDRITNQDDTGVNDALSGSTSTQGARSGTGSSYSTRGTQNIFIQPTTVIQGETIIIGDTGLEQASESIGDIAVRAIAQAYETGELTVGQT
jgi:hypothetical protein